MPTKNNFYSNIFSASDTDHWISPVVKYTDEKMNPPPPSYHDTGIGFFRMYTTTREKERKASSDYKA